MNRQFVSLLRSEQDTQIPVIGDPKVWEKILGPRAQLTKLEYAFDPKRGGSLPSRSFPFLGMAKWVYRKPSKFIPFFNHSILIIKPYYYD